MPTREDRRDKWFIDISPDDTSAPPQRRYPGSEVEEWNSATVEPRLEGADYIEEWGNLVQKMIGQASPAGLILHAGWTLESVETNPGHPSSESLFLLQMANKEGLGVYVSLSGDLFTKRTTEQSVSELGFDTAAIDSRYATFGSNHMKYTLFATNHSTTCLVGSIDIATNRLDDEEHPPDRPARRGGPIHELGVKLQGPVVRDIFRSFEERWNDETRKLPKGAYEQDIQMVLDDLKSTTLGNPVVPDNWTLFRLAAAGWNTYPPKLATDFTWFITGDSEHDVQILRTFGSAGPETAIDQVERVTAPGYSWTKGPRAGEFTVWASYLNAIEKAGEYIYIEDKDVVPFGPPPGSDGEAESFSFWYEEDGELQELSPFYQLSEAIKRGVDVVIVTNKNRGPDSFMNYNHVRGVQYLLKASESASGDFRIAHLEKEDRSINVHSKVMIVDDEVVLLGSANFSRRSFTNDGELHLAVVDGNDDFATSTRKSLWSEHYDGPFEDSLDADLSKFKKGIRNEAGRLVDHSSIGWNKESMPTMHGFWLKVYDPYGGPPPADLVGDGTNG